MAGRAPFPHFFLEGAREYMVLDALHTPIEAFFSILFGISLSGQMIYAHPGKVPSPPPKPGTIPTK